MEPRDWLDGHDEASVRAAFEKVENKDHWKGPIDAVIDAKDRNIVAFAIEFYTATTATFRPVKAGEFAVGMADEVAGRLRVTAPGYWAGPAN